MMRAKFFRIIIVALISLNFVGVSKVGTAQTIAFNTAQYNELLLHTKARRYNGDVIFIRGGFGVFSKGLDAMSATLAKRGVKSRVVRNSEVVKTYQAIVQNQKRYGSKPVVIVGHSWGADAAIQIARYLTKNRVRVSFLVTLAATAPKPIPSNVRKATNYYFKTNGWGRPVQRGKGMRGRIKNIDLSTKQGIHHFNIEKKPRIQRQIVNQILRTLKRGKRA